MKSYEIDTAPFNERYIALIKRIFSKAGFTTFEDEKNHTLTITAVGEDDEEILKECEFFYLFS